jgi:hypothetical protein
MHACAIRAQKKPAFTDPPIIGITGSASKNNFPPVARIHGFLGQIVSENDRILDLSRPDHASITQFFLAKTARHSFHGDN